ncbi:MAG: toast rack family protein [Chloroflexi bacterium]|nr:toast rack family protein [Chloroflexota bacterium]
MSNKIMLMVLVLALATLACGFQTNFQTTKTPSPDIVDEISVDAPLGAVSLELKFGAGKMSLAPGAKKLVEGTVTYNIADFKPEIKTDGTDVSMSQGNYKMTGFPRFDGITNEWDLKLGSAPMDLTINSGAYEGNFDFGGLALTNLSVNDGAAEVTVDFSSPNAEKMSVLSYKTGASNVTLKNLGNANFGTLVFESGAGNYKLDFGGKLQRDGSVSVRSGMSNLTLVIPTGVAATVKVSSGLSNVQFPSSWSQHGDTYTQEGSGPVLTIIVETGAGNVQITQ